MGEFFRGWRRKAGCVTLVMACALMVAWLRSLIIRDEITVHGTPKQTGVSMDGFLIWSRFAPDATKTEVTWTAKVITPKLRDESRRRGIYDWKWECCGFLFGAITTEARFWSGAITFTETAHYWVFPFTATEHYWQVPYWSLSVPFTLLSAYLILWKPRKVGAGQKCEPSAAETTQPSLTDFRGK